MNRRNFLSDTLAAFGTLQLLGETSLANTPQGSVREVLVMFKCHLDVGFVDTQAAIIHKYFTDYYPRAISTAEMLRAKGDDGYVWTTGSWLLYEYFQQAKGKDLETMEHAVQRGDIAWHALPFTWQSELLDRSAIRAAVGFSKVLDRRFGRRTTGAKMTDVPGHTRGLVGPLHEAGVIFLDIGVNSASTPPDVPPLFVWRDPAGASIIVMYHRTDYGGVVQVPGSDLAIAVEVRDDNSGPHTIDEIHQIYAKLRDQFPGARVRPSNLTEIANAVQKYEDGLPVFTQEIGDTWIHGVASDPIKLGRYRELLRLRSEWIQQGKIEPGNSVDLAFLSKFALAVEHTWGTDTKTWLDFEHYKPQALSSMLDNSKYRTVTGSWAEKRRDIDDSVNALPGSLREEAQTRLAALRPALPDPEEMKEVAAGSLIETRLFRMRIDEKTGAIIMLQDPRSGAQFASEQHPLALFTYQTLSQDDYDRFIRSYITVQTDWALKDFGKPNIGRFGAQSRKWNATTAKVWRGYRDDGDRVLVRLDLGAQAADAVTAWPEKVFLEIDFTRTAPTIDMNLSWFGKRANRMPEALWLTFQPEVGNQQKWQFTKLEQAVSPFDVVSGGNRHMHAPTGPIVYRDEKRTMAIDSLDAAVVSLGVMSPIYFSKDEPDISKGFHYSLFNNGWGTNYIQWFGEDARFRFRLKLI
jgi:Domain of unknown function (DUF5054)